MPSPARGAFHTTVCCTRRSSRVLPPHGGAAGSWGSAEIKHIQQEQTFALTACPQSRATSPPAWGQGADGG